MSEDSDNTLQASPEAEAAGPESAAPAAAPLVGGGSAGKGRVMRHSLPRTTGDMSASGAGGGEDTGAIHAAAEQGTATAGGALPHRARLEGAFGLDLSSIIAHTGSDAQRSAGAMGAEAYASGNHVVVPPSANPGLVAHEVTHVLQQQKGVQLKGGVDGGAGDPYEREADAIGAAVESGESVAHHFAGTGGVLAGGTAVQRRVVQRDSSSKLPGPVLEVKPDPAAMDAKLNEIRVMKAQAGLAQLAKRWKDELPTFFDSVTDEVDVKVPVFRQKAYNLIVQDKIDLAPVREVLKAPGREKHAAALTEAEQVADFDKPQLEVIREHVKLLIAGGQLQRLRQELMVKHAQLSPWGKRALVEVAAFGVNNLEAYAAGEATSHGKLEESYLDTGTWDMGQDEVRMEKYGQGSYYRPIAVKKILAMLRDKPPTLEQTEASSAAGQPKPAPEENVVDRAQANELEALIVVAVNEAEAAADRLLTLATITMLEAKIAGITDGARDLVWANTPLVARLVAAVSPKTAERLIGQMDPVARLYEECKKAAASDEEEQKYQFGVKLNRIASYGGALRLSEDVVERRKFGKDSAVYPKLRGWLKARPSEQQKPLRKKLLDHTKLKDDFIDRLQLEQNRTVHRLIQRGSEDKTAEDKMFEAIEDKKGADAVMALRDLASTRPDRIKQLETDMVFRTGMGALTEEVTLPDGATVRPWHIALLMWGIQPGEASDPGTIKLTEVNRTGDTTPLKIEERQQLESQLFVPCLKEIRAELTGENLSEDKTKRGDDEMSRDKTRQYLAKEFKTEKGDPQAIQNILVNYDRRAAAPDFVKLLQREGLVFGNEIQKRYFEQYGVDLRTWVYQHSGPVNRSGSSRVLGLEQGSSVGMINGRVVMASEMDQKGKMTLHQALREHGSPKGSSAAMPIYEWGSVWSRRMHSDLGNKEKLLQHWTEFRGAVAEVRAEIEAATGIKPIRAIDLIRNAYLEHSGHFETNLKNKWQSKADDYSAIRDEMGLVDGLDVVPGAPAPSISEQAERNFRKPAELLWAALSLLTYESEEKLYSAASALMAARFLPRIPEPSRPMAEPQAAPTNNDQAATSAPNTVEERPPRSFSAYYRLQYGTSPELHATAVIRSISTLFEIEKTKFHLQTPKRKVSAERAAEIFQLPEEMVTGEVAIPDEDASIGEHNRHLVHASFKEGTAKEVAQQIWVELVNEGRMSQLQTILGKFNDEEQRLIRIKFRRLSGGYDLTFYIRQLIETRKQTAPRKGGFSLTGIQYGTRVAGEGTSEAEGLDKQKMGHTYGLGGGSFVANHVGEVVSASSDAELDQMLAISMQGELSVADRIRAAIKRDSDGEVVRVIDELTVEERRHVLKNGALLSEIHGQLGQYNYERAFKVLTGQGDLADRLYSRSHGGSWWERKVWGGTDEEGMRQDIRIYIRHLRLQHNAEVRDQVTQTLAASGENRAPDQEAIDKEVNRRVGAACAKIASDKSVKAIMKAELDKDELAEMEAMILGGGSTAIEWALAGGEGKAKILADINAMTQQQRRERLDDPTYMRMLGQRVTNEKDYRDLVNALKQGLEGGDGLAKLDEATRTGAQVQGGSANQDKTFAALGALSAQEFAKLKQDPVLQGQVLRAVKPEQQQLVRDFLAGPEGAVPVETLVRKPVAPPAAPAVDPAAPAAPAVVPGGDPAKAGAQAPAPAPAQAPAQPDPAAVAAERKKAEEAAQKKNIQYLVHQATHRLRFPMKALRGWSIVLEQAVEVAKSPLPKQKPADTAQAGQPGQAGQAAPPNPRQMVWDNITSDASTYGALHDVQRGQYKTATSFTSQDLTGTDMQSILKTAVVDGVDPSEHLIAAKIMTKDEMLTPKERELGIRLYDPKRPNDHVVKEGDINDALNSASDEIVVQRWTTHMAGPPGAKDGTTLKTIYDSFAKARDKARPTIEQEERKAREAKAAKAAAANPPTPVSTGTVSPVSGGGDAAIDAAAKQGKQQLDWDKGVQKLTQPGGENAEVSDAALKKREFLEFRTNVSSIFEAMLRQWVGDDDKRQLTAEGSYNPDQVKTDSSGNKRYQNFVETLLARIPNLNPEVIAQLLGMAPEDRWMVKSNMRQEGAQLELTEEKNLRFGGGQRKENGVASEEYQQFQLQRYLYTRMFAGVTTDGVVDGGEKEGLEHRRSENDRAREAYKVALETSAMWASLITSVLITIAATILTGGLALGPIGMLAIGGITTLLSAHAQAAVNKEILQDEFDTKDKRELVTREVVTGLVTLGTTYYAQRLISVLGKIPKALGQANAARQVLGKPPTIWASFLREGSEEAISELGQTYVDAGLEATNPEHWVDGFTEGAKQSKRAVDRILATADERAFTGALTALVTAGVSRGRSAARRKRGVDGKPDTWEFDAPIAGRKREINRRRNLREAFGDPEEKISGTLIEWAVQQSMNGGIDWANAPQDLLKGLLQEYKEVGTERLVRDAHAGGRNRRVDRHLAINKGFLNGHEQKAYEQVARTSDDTAPFMTVQDFARVRAEVAMSGMTAWEGDKNKTLTPAQREAFIKHVRDAKDNEDLYRRAKEDPLSIPDVANADLAASRANQQVGFALRSEDAAKQVMRDLADGKPESLRLLGIEPPKDFDSTKNEWGLGKKTDPTSGEVSYLLIRGEAAAVDWANFPGVEPIGHSHPDMGTNHLHNVGADGTVSVKELIQRDHVDRTHFLPSGADVMFVLQQGIQEHTVFTPFQAHGDDRVGNPTPGSNTAGVSIVMRNPRPAGNLFGSEALQVGLVDIEVRAGDKVLYTGQMWGCNHPSMGSLVYGSKPEHLVEPAAAPRPEQGGQREAAEGRDGPVEAQRDGDLESSKREPGQSAIPLYGLRKRLGLLTPSERRFVNNEAIVNQTGRHTRDPQIIATHVNVLVDMGPLTEQEARALMRELADGNCDGIRARGIAIPGDFDSKQNEWGLALMEGGAYGIIRGAPGSVSRTGIRGVADMPGHSHPLEDDRQITTPTHINAILNSNRAYLLHPSGAKADVGVARWQPGHTIYLPYQHLGNGMLGQTATNQPNQPITNADIAGRAPGLEVRIVEGPRIIGTFGTDANGQPAPVYRVPIQYWAGNDLLYEDDFVLFRHLQDGTERIEPARNVPMLLGNAQQENAANAQRAGLGYQVGPVDAVEVWRGPANQIVGFEMFDRNLADSVLRRAAAGDASAFTDIGMVNAGITGAPSLMWGLGQRANGAYVLVRGDFTSITMPAGMTTVAFAEPSDYHAGLENGTGTMAVSRLNDPASVDRDRFLPNWDRLAFVGQQGSDMFVYQTSYRYQRPAVAGGDGRLLDAAPHTPGPENPSLEPTVQVMMSRPVLAGTNFFGVQYYRAHVNLVGTDGTPIWSGDVWVSPFQTFTTQPPDLVPATGPAQGPAPVAGPNANTVQVSPGTPTQQQQIVPPVPDLLPPTIDPQARRGGGDDDDDGAGRRRRGRDRDEDVEEDLPVSEGATVLQTGDHVFQEQTAQALNRHFFGDDRSRYHHRREWGKALEKLKRASRLGADHHGRIMSNGDYTQMRGGVIDNLGVHLTRDGRNAVDFGDEVDTTGAELAHEDDVTSATGVVAGPHSTPAPHAGTVDRLLGRATPMSRPGQVLGNAGGVASEGLGGSYLDTNTIQPSDLPYDTKLRQNRYDPSKLATSFADIPRANVKRVTDTYLTCEQAGGSAGVVALGELADGRPVAVKRYAMRQGMTEADLAAEMLTEARSAQMMSDMGIGATFHGMYQDAPGRWAIVMDVVPGDFESGAVTPESLFDMDEMLRRLDAAGVKKLDDFQPYRTQEGRLMAIDPGRMVDMVGVDHETTGKNGSHSSARAGLLLQAAQDVGVQYLEYLRQTDPVAWRGVLEYMHGQSKYIAVYKKYEPYWTASGVIRVVP